MYNIKLLGDNSHLSLARFNGGECDCEFAVEWSFGCSRERRVTKLLYFLIRRTSPSLVVYIVASFRIESLRRHLWQLQTP